MYQCATSSYPFICLWTLRLFHVLAIVNRLQQTLWYMTFFVCLFLFFCFVFFFNLFMAVLGLCFCARDFFSCGKRGPLLIVVCGSLTIAASPVAEHRLQTRRLSNRGPRAQQLRGTQDPPRPGLEPMLPASAGRLPTTAPPGKPT